MARLAAGLALTLALLVPVRLSAQGSGEYPVTTSDSRLARPLMVSAFPSTSPEDSLAQAARSRTDSEEEGNTEEWVGAAIGGVTVGLAFRGLVCAGDDTPESCEEGLPAFLLGFALGAILGAGIGSAL